MTDDVPAQITILTPTTDVETTHWGRLAPTLWHAGLIWSRYEQVAFELPQPELRIWCTFTDRVAFDTWRSNSLVIERCSELLATPIQVTETVAPWDRHDHICVCKDSSAFILMGHGFGYRQAILFCCDCLGYYPNYRTFELVGDLLPTLHSWALIYGHVSDIWMLSGDLELWASNELQSPTSQLNKQGRKYAKQIHRLIKRPVWYYLFVESDKRTSTCPSCGINGKCPDWNRTKYACEMCSCVY